jgi:hypothetical protein
MVRSGVVSTIVHGVPRIAAPVPNSRSPFDIAVSIPEETARSPAGGSSGRPRRLVHRLPSAFANSTDTLSPVSAWICRSAVRLFATRRRCARKPIARPSARTGTTTQV